MAETEDDKALVEQTGQNVPEVSGFGSAISFELIQRQANLLAKSDLVPKEFKGKVANCVIALEMAQRVGASPMAVMQNLYIVHGKPSWSSQFIIAAINNTRKYSPLRFDIKGEGMQQSCRAWAIEKGTGERLEGPEVTMQMAKDEGWIDKNGSKWKTMPELMMRYRAGTFFGRLYAPEVLMGMQTVDEIHDISSERAGGAAALMEQFKEPIDIAVEETVPEQENPPVAETGGRTGRSSRRAATKESPKDKLQKALSDYCGGDMIMAQDVLKEVSYYEKNNEPQFIEDIDKASDEHLKKAYDQLQSRIEEES